MGGLSKSPKNTLADQNSMGVHRVAKKQMAEFKLLDSVLFYVYTHFFFLVPLSNDVHNENSLTVQIT